MGPAQVVILGNNLDFLQDAKISFEFWESQDNLLTWAPAATSFHLTAADSSTSRMGMTAKPETDLPACQRTSTPFLVFPFRRPQTTSVGGSDGQIDQGCHHSTILNTQFDQNNLRGGRERARMGILSRGCSRPAHLVVVVIQASSPFPDTLSPGILLESLP